MTKIAESLCIWGKECGDKKIGTTRERERPREAGWTWLWWCESWLAGSGPVYTAPASGRLGQAAGRRVLVTQRQGRAARRGLACVLPASSFCLLLPALPPASRFSGACDGLARRHPITGYETPGAARTRDPLLPLPSLCWARGTWRLPVAATGLASPRPCFLPQSLRIWLPLRCRNRVPARSFWWKCWVLLELGFRLLAAADPVWGNVGRWRGWRWRSWIEMGCCLAMSSYSITGRAGQGGVGG